MYWLTLVFGKLEMCVVESVIESETGITSRLVEGNNNTKKIQQKEKMKETKHCKAENDATEKLVDLNPSL